MAPRPGPLGTYHAAGILRRDCESWSFVQGGKVHPLPDSGHLDQMLASSIFLVSLPHSGICMRCQDHTRARVIIAQKLATTAASTHASGLAWRLGRTLGKGASSSNPASGPGGGD
jgi:hypothetical protein